MAAPRPWTDADAAELARRHAAGESLHSIAKAMGRGKGTISAKSAAAGLKWERTRTAAAAQAVHIDNKARRVALVARLYTRAETVLGRLETSPFQTLVKVAGGAEVTGALPFVPTRDERDLADVVSRHLVSANRLEQVDSGGAEHVRSLLAGMAEQLGLTQADTVDPS